MMAGTALFVKVQPGMLGFCLAVFVADIRMAGEAELFSALFQEEGVLPAVGLVARYAPIGHHNLMDTERLFHPFGNVGMAFEAKGLGIAFEEGFVVGFMRGMAIGTGP